MERREQSMKQHGFHEVIGIPLVDVLNFPLWCCSSFRWTYVSQAID